MSKTKQSHAKNPTMTPASTAPIFTNNKHKTLAVEDILEEQQKAIAPMRTLTLIWVGFLGVHFWGGGGGGGGGSKIT